MFAWMIFDRRFVSRVFETAVTTEQTYVLHRVFVQTVNIAGVDVRLALLS